MTHERTFPMALRTGNWGASVMLPFHRPVRITLAPEGALDQVLSITPALPGVPEVLGPSDLDRVTVSDAGGRPVLRFDRLSGEIERGTSKVLGTARDWELRIEGPRGLICCYGRGDSMPSAELLDELLDRLGVTAAVD